MKLPTEDQIKAFDTGTLVMVANQMGISRARWDEVEDLRALVLDKVRQQQQRRTINEPCPECGFMVHPNGYCRDGCILNEKQGHQRQT